jgi:hypothetical protein
MLGEMFATLGLEGEGTSEERAIRLNNVIEEDFETLVHYYNDFELVVLLQSLPFGELTQRTGHEGFLTASLRSNTGIG